jgi:hypothetical protein
MPLWLLMIGVELPCTFEKSVVVGSSCALAFCEIGQRIARHDATGRRAVSIS